MLCDKAPNFNRIEHEAQLSQRDREMRRVIEYFA